MFVDVALVPQEVEHMPLVRFSAVAVIDVLRATTTMATALANGARGVVPVATPEEALAWRAAGAGVLLGGERGAQRIPGFDLGNSPFEYSPERVAGRLIVLTTTNGTLAFRRVLAAAGGRPPELIAACLRNASACAWHLREHAAAAGGGVLLVCAGTNGWFSWEDAYCASVLLQCLAQLGPVEYGDGARAAARLGAGSANAREELSQSRHGRRLLDLGFHEDIAYCAQSSVCTTVPRLLAGVLVSAGGPHDPGGKAGAADGRGE
ncbi:MAG TPA: 2-phosphosulfolactate phosphatase [Limnochordales bacterium]